MPTDELIWEAPPVIEAGSVVVPLSMFTYLLVLEVNRADNVVRCVKYTYWPTGQVFPELPPPGRFWYDERDNRSLPGWQQIPDKPLNNPGRNWDRLVAHAGRLFLDRSADAPAT